MKKEMKPIVVDNLSDGGYERLVNGCPYGHRPSSIGCEVSGLVNTCLVRKDGEVAELLWADFAGGEVSGFSADASVCDALGSCAPVGAEGVVSVTTDPVRVSPAREYVEVDAS